MLVDSHCHMDFFKDPEFVVNRAIESNVNFIVSCATNTNSIKKHVELAEKFGEIRVCLGIHPADFLGMGKKEVEKGILLIEKNIGVCAGIGEIGLDYKYAKTAEQKDSQEELFRRQIKIALNQGLPVVVHARFAEQRAMEVLVEEGAKKVLMHWFTNSLESVKKASELGFFMSCGPIILSSKEALEIAKQIPLKNLVLETDAPVSFLGKQSEPFWVKMVAEKLSVEKNVKKEVLEEKTTKNAFELFGLNLNTIKKLVQ